MSHPIFHVGEIAIAQQWQGSYEIYNGEEVEIVGELKRRRLVRADRKGQIFERDAYAVQTRDGTRVACLETQLTKKFDPSTWSACFFKPKHSTREKHR